MEMSFDWNQYRKFFKANDLPTAQRAYWVIENEAVVAGISEGREDLDWTGAAIQEVGKTLPGKEYVFIQKDRLDQMLMEAIRLPHFPQQIENLRQKILHSKDLRFLSQKNFFETAFQGFWRHLLPNRFAFYLQVRTIEQNGAESFEELAMIFKNGFIEKTFCPEMFYLKPERQGDSLERVKALSERLVMPSYGLVVDHADWRAIVNDAHPMKRLGGMVLRKKVTPLQWSSTLRFLAMLRWLY